MEFVKVGLSSFALTYVLSLWYKTDRLREKAGIYFVYDKAGEPIDRDDAGGLGAWLNCPMCCAILTFPLAWLLRGALSGLGLALLLVRWFEGARVKARWWE